MVWVSARAGTLALSSALMHHEVMAIKTTTELIDDVDGTKADQTVDFSFLGTRYEIDLTAKHTDQMRKALQPWLDRARRANGKAVRHRTTHARSVTKTKPTYDEIRAWAKENGLRVAEKGRIANTVIEQFMASR